MTSLVACLGAGKGTWVPVMKVAESPSWDQIFLIMPAFFADKFENTRKNTTIIKIDENRDFGELINDIKTALDGKLFADVAVNLMSGSGKEHMALLAALLKLGCGIRLVAQTEKDGLKEL
ncbi:hypothetical protein HY492_02095 [Candidatus Woesearchaeota archaeon]|nr:hypothetical protein [Candidatus Woesearchaeota archaeon]